MRPFGGWFRAVATILASLAVIVSTAVTAFAAGAPPFVPASHGRLSEPTQASGGWGLALAVIGGRCNEHSRIEGCSPTQLAPRTGRAGHGRHSVRDG